MTILKSILIGLLLSTVCCKESRRQKNCVEVTIVDRKTGKELDSVTIKIFRNDTLIKTTSLCEKSYYKIELENPGNYKMILLRNSFFSDTISDVLFFKYSGSEDGHGSWTYIETSKLLALNTTKNELVEILNREEKEKKKEQKITDRLIKKVIKHNVCDGFNF